jgi:hypothetical protein
VEYFFSIGGGSEISGVSPLSQVYLNGSALSVWEIYFNKVPHYHQKKKKS